ncbi:MAG: PadR family transcriptional regulator [Coriobacteriia bacterium]|nr:PadR family transcriptional regulator [Coriobacteriia bacterium]
MHTHHDHNGKSCGHGKHGFGGFGMRGFRPPFGPGMHPHGFGGPGRARRGDVRAAVLRLLSESPMHGYQIIQELSARSDGAWSPSAGSVYPTLQLLADEGLIVAEETAGKKVFSLTEAGIAAVAETADQPAPWEDAAQSGTGVAGYREAVGKFMAAAFQIGKTGSAEQIAAGIEVMTETRKKLYAILSED